MMVIAVGLSSYTIALFHLVNHAFYKALLFLGAGAVIHAVNDNQDFRKYGGLISYLPLSYSIMLIASLSLVAFPFMTGFYSKDLILESAYGQYNLSSIIVYFIASIGAMFTTLYSVKVLYITFLSNPNGPLVNYKHVTQKSAHEGDIFMSLPLIILAIFSIFFGFITKDIFIGLGSDFFSDNALFIHSSNEIMINTEFFVPVIYKLLPLFFTIFFTILSILFTEFYPKLLIRFKYSVVGYNLFSFFNQRFAVELIYNKYISGVVLTLGGQTSKDMDKGIVETFGPLGLQNKFTEISKSINNLSTGVVTNYALYILLGLLFFLNVLFFSNFININYILIIILIVLSCFASVFGTNPPHDKNMLRSDFGADLLTSVPEAIQIFNKGFDLIRAMDLSNKPAIFQATLDLRNNIFLQSQIYYEAILRDLKNESFNIKMIGHELYISHIKIQLDELRLKILDFIAEDVMNIKDEMSTNYPELYSKKDNSLIQTKNFIKFKQDLSRLSDTCRLKDLDLQQSMQENPQILNT